MAPFTLYVLHHSHTDIGYTNTQETIRRQHIAYIQQAMDLARQEPAFVWNCETFWCVEAFLQTASPAQTSEFCDLVQAGKIGLSATPLNLTELVSAPMLNATLRHQRAALARLGLTARAALTADINGYAWGYADRLLNHGVEFLLSCVHPVHGARPLQGLPQTPFWWQAPSGRRLLVWVGDHYQLGNELGIAQAYAREYTLQDGLDEQIPDLFARAERRIFTYVDTLRARGYAYDFAPVSVSGIMTDNAPPGPAIPAFIKRFNALHGDAIRLQMVTLDDFYQVVRSQRDLPVYTGDWTDWWADGVGSTPGDVAHFRAAQRLYHTALQWPDADPALLEETRQNLLLYAEHTWGHNASVAAPYAPEVALLEQGKRRYALQAYHAAEQAVWQLRQARGARPGGLPDDPLWTVYNPYPYPLTTPLTLPIGAYPGVADLAVTDASTGQTVPHQLLPCPQGPQLVLTADLPANGSAAFALRPLAQTDPAPAPRAVEQISIQTDYFDLTVTAREGIAALRDRHTGRELTAPGSSFAPFAPVHQITPLADGQDPVQARFAMGLARRTAQTQTVAGRVRRLEQTADGPILTVLELTYDLPACYDCRLVLTIYKHLPRIEAELRLHKQDRLQPEGVYVALPFTAGAHSQTVLDKTGCLVRPALDQLPGACAGYFLTQTGVAFAGRDRTLLVTCPDTPLIAVGDLADPTPRLAGQAGVQNSDPVFAWCMNNYWETNFKATLGGFYDFRYTLTLLPAGDLPAAFETARAAQGVLSAITQRT